MIQQAVADSFKAPSYPWPLPPPVPQPTLLNALEQEIPVQRIAKRISEMIEAGRQPGSDTAENQWATVEAGLKLYLEFARAASSANPPAPVPGLPMPLAPVPEFPAVPPAPVPDLPAGNRIVPFRESPQRPGSAPQKYRLGRHLESEDRLRSFMVYQRPLSGMIESTRSLRRLPKVSVQPQKEDLSGNKTGAPAADPIKESQGRTLILWAKFGAAAVITLASATGYLLLQPPSPGKSVAQVSRATTPTFTITSPVATAVASDQSGKTSATATPAPAGWASQAAYEAWSPKFDVSLEATNDY